jgi:hypothetical protein
VSRIPLRGRGSIHRSLLSAAAAGALIVAAPAVAQTLSGSSTGGPGDSATAGVITSPLTVDYALSARQEYVDNYGFRGVSTFISSVGPSATFRMDSETLRVAGNVGVFATYFSNANAGRSHTGDPRFRFDGSYLRERSTFGLSVNYFRDRQFGTSAIQPAGGFQLGSGTRTLFSIAPSYSHAVTERLSFNTSYGHSTITTQGGDASQQVDTQTGSLSGGFQYRLTEIDGVGVSVSQTSYSTTPATTDSDTRAVQLSWNRRWSEVTTLSAFVGVTRSDIQSRSSQSICLLPVEFCLAGLFPFQVLVNNQNSSTTSPTYGFTFATQLSPRTAVSAAANRGIIPGASGSLQERTSVSLDLNHQFLERFSGGVEYVWATNALSGFGGNSPDSTLQTLGASLSYQLPDNWNLGAGARWSETDLSGTTARSKAVFVTISKAWPNRRLWP